MPPRKNLLAPRYWGYHLLALVLTAAAVGFGVWQFNAWSERRAQEARDLTRIEAQPIASVMGPDDRFPGDKVGHPVVVSGTWLPESTVLISGRKVDGVEGYWVATPLSIGAAGDPALPVVRGWTASATEVPAAPQGEAELVVWLQPGEGTGQVDDDPDDDVLPQLRIADLLNRVDGDLYGAYGVVADEVADGDWPVGEAATNDGTTGLKPATLEQLPATAGTTALKNLLYAIEWWIFGGFVVFIWWRWVRDELDNDDEDDDVPATPSPHGAETHHSTSEGAEPHHSTGGGGQVDSQA